ncbi:hypothetical protein V8E53_006406 [Lactarius tabidus]
MCKVIHHEDGSMLTKVERKAVHQSALIVACSNLASLPHTVQLMDNQPHKKIFFKHFFLTDWVKALCKLESLAPLLSLCAGKYKANMTLSMVLQDNFTWFQCDAPTIPSSSSLHPLLMPPPLMEALLPALPSSLPLALPPHPLAVRCKPSPVLAEKRARSVNCSDARTSRPPSPCPAFLAMSHSGVATDTPTTPHTPSAETAPQKTPYPRPVHNKSAPKATDIGHCARLDSDDVSTQPQSEANALALAAGTTDGAEDEGLDDGDDGLCLEDLTQDELLGWIDRCDIEAQTKQVQKEDII